MAGSPFWGGSAAEGETFLYNEPWFLGWIAGRPLPGKTTVSPGTVASLDFEDKKAKGRHGSNITIYGYKPGTYDLSCEIWTADQHTAIQAVIDAVWTVPKKKAKISELGLTVHHPALAEVKIFSGVLIGVDPPKDGGSLEGAKVYRFRFREFVPPSKDNATKTAKASAVTVAEPLRKDQAPKNAAPPRPSTVRADLGPRGPKTPPGGGSD